MAKIDKFNKSLRVKEIRKEKKILDAAHFFP
jgi:hypothetical protein